MFQKVALTDISAWDVAAPLAVGGALGVGARLLRQGYDLKTKRGIRAPKMPTSVESAQIEVPVDISPEEAEELRAQGVKIGAVLDRCGGGSVEGVPEGIKVAVAVGAPTTSPPGTAIPVKKPVLPAPQPRNSTSLPGPGVTMKGAAEGLAANVMQGLLGAGAAAGGWALLDNRLDADRVEKARGSLNRSRERVRRLIAGEADPSEVGAATALKTAEELFFKTALGVGDVAAPVIGGIGDLMAPIGIPLGIGAALLAAKSYNETKSNNKYRQRVKQISESLEHEDPLPSIAVLHPVVRKPKNSPADAGVMHGAAEPTPSPELDKVAAHSDDDEESSTSTWIMLAIAGLAGAAGIMWVRSNPEEAMQLAPDWLKPAAKFVIDFGKPDPGAAAKVQEVMGKPTNGAPTPPPKSAPPEAQAKWKADLETWRAKQVPPAGAGAPAAAAAAAKPAPAAPAAPVAPVTPVAPTPLAAKPPGASPAAWRPGDAPNAGMPALPGIPAAAPAAPAPVVRTPVVPPSPPPPAVPVTPTASV